MKRYTLIFAAVLCLLLSASASPAKDTWTSVRSKNFYLIGNASDKEVRQVAVKLEQFRYVFTRLLPGIKFTSPVPTTVIVFKSDSSYKPYKPVVDGKVSEVAGYFQGGRDVNYITLTTEKGQDNPFSTIFHEYVHLLVNNTLGEGSVPPWFNEGLAEYYSTFEIEDNQKVFLGKLISDHLLLLRDQKLVPLQTLFKIDNYSLHRNRREAKGVFYAQSWALIHYLVQGNKGERVPQMGRFLEMVMANTPVEKAFKDAFQSDFAAMEKELKEYVGRREFMTSTATFERKLEFETEMQSAPISEAEALATLGDLLLHIRRPADAEGRLQQSLTMDANQPLALSSLGMIRVEQKRYAEALPLLKRAAEASSQNYLAHYYYAYALSRESMSADETVSSFPAESANVMRAELKKAIELKPDYPESYYLLAFVQMVTGDIDDGIKIMRKALELSPGNQIYAYMLAQAYMRKGNYEQARALLTGLAQSASEPGLRASAQSMLNALSSIESRSSRNASGEGAGERGYGPGRRYDPRLNKRETSQGGTGVEPPAPPPEREAPSQSRKTYDATEALREVLRAPQTGERRVQGLLVRIDCDAKGIVFTIRVGEKLLKLHVEKFEDMDISTYTTDIGGELSCGPRNPENAVVVTYSPSTAARGRVDGEAVALEFVPKDFVLEKK